MADSSSKTSVEEEPAIAKSERPEAGDPAMAEPPTPPAPPLPDWELLSMSSLSNSASFDAPTLPQTAVAASDKETSETKKKNKIGDENPISTPLPTPPPPPPPLPDSPEPFSEGWKPRGIFSAASSDPPPLQPLHLVMDDSPSSPSPFPPRETLKEEEKEQGKGEEREEEEAEEEEQEEGVVSMDASENPVQHSGSEKIGDSERGGGGKKGRAWTMPPPPPLWSIAIAAVAVVGLICLWHHERSHDRSLLTQISSQNEHKATTVRAER